MGVLRARSGGTWIDIGTVGVPGPPGPDEVFIGPNDPGGTYDLWVDTDEAGPSQPLAVEAASFTPVWTGLVLGTGSINVGRYVYVGGPNVGDVGQMNLAVYAKFGTAGQTFPTQATFNTPPGFAVWPVSDADGSQGDPIGQVRCNDISPGAAYVGPIRLSTLTVLRCMTLNVAGTYPTETNLTTVAPFTWAAGDSIMGNASFMAKRV